MGNTGQSGTQTQTGLPWWLECFLGAIPFFSLGICRPQISM